MDRKVPAALALSPLLLGWATPGSATGAPDTPIATLAAISGQDALAGQDEGSTAPSREWEFALVGYAWLAGAEGETDVIGPAEPVGLDLSFGDVLDSLKFVLMGAAEARRDRLVILGDLTFIHLEANKGIDIREQDFLDAELDSRTAEVTLLGGYRVADKGPVAVDLLAGGRLNHFKGSLLLEGPNRSAEGSIKENWFDLLIAARVQAPLSGKFSLSAYGDIGGFGIGSDLTWQATATVSYRINRRMDAGLGWRHFKVNYDHGDFLYDVAQSGPILVFRTKL
jgi:hypothetical protein